MFGLGIQELIVILIILGIIGGLIIGVIFLSRKLKKLSKPFFLGSQVVGLGLFIISVAIGFTRGKGDQPEEGLRIISLGIIPLLISVVVVMILFYKMWAAIQDGHARTSPGKAIGFSFIPLFNLYWIFQLIWGFSEDYNSYIKRHSVNALKLPEGLFFIYSIFIPISGVIARINAPFPVDLSIFIVLYFIHLLVISKICDGVNSILNAPKIVTLQDH